MARFRIVFCITVGTLAIEAVHARTAEFDVEPPTAMFGQIVTGDEILVALDLYFSPAK